jgi:hypothetical protein
MHTGVLRCCFTQRDMNNKLLPVCRRHHLFTGAFVYFRYILQNITRKAVRQFF